MDRKKFRKFTPEFPLKRHHPPIKSIDDQFYCERTTEGIDRALKTYQSIRKPLANDERDVIFRAFGTKNLESIRLILAQTRTPADIASMRWADLISCAEAIIRQNKHTKPINNETAPDDVITLTVACQNFCVSRSTLKRSIQKGMLKSYQKKPNSSHLVSRREVGNYWPRR